MHRTVQSHPDHLSDAARVIAVGLVDLRLQHRLHVSRLAATRIQASSWPMCWKAALSFRFKAWKPVC